MMTIEERGTVSVVMGVFNNLVLYDQHAPQNSFDTIKPDLATSWKWNDDATELTFAPRTGLSGMMASWT